ncbi:odorant receptor 22c-like [Diorhabda sublineata]|uniref:odorant receptor 22c-like n=1 Tax=Diorhabda sublineata TaxID=1163346 RepID=UPI0024E091F6|nr:odorant receptor 22c-like [Diorhabda sublineata]
MIGSFTHMVHTIMSGEYNRVAGDITYISSYLTSYIAVWAFIIKLNRVAEIHIFLADIETFGKPQDFDRNNNNFNKYSKINYVFVEFMVWTSVSGSNIFQTKNCQEENLKFNLTEVCGLATYTWLPFDIDYSPVKEIYLMFQIFGVHLLYVVCGFMAWQVFEITQHIIIRMRDVKYVMFKALNQEDPLKRKNQLHFAIRYHNALFGLVDRVNEIFGPFMFTHMVVTSIIMGTGIYMFLHSNSLSSMFVFIGWLWGLCMVCFSGQRLQNESSELAVAVYDLPWYDCDQELKKDVLFVLHRCQEFQVLNAEAFGIMDNEMFLGVLKLTYSYITLLGNV